VSDDHTGPRSDRPGITADGVVLEPLANGVSRVSWSPELQQRGFEAATAAVRALVDRAFTDLKQARVEAWVSPDDLVGLRIATWAGLRREGILRAAHEEDGRRHDRVVLARVESDVPVHEPSGFRSLLNSFLPRKRAIAQMLIRDPADRVLLCQLTYKADWDLPGGVVEVGESPQAAVAREVKEELDLSIEAGGLLLTDWLPPWGGWDDAICLVFDGGVHEPSLTDGIVAQQREIRSARFCTREDVRRLCADFTARRITAALESLSAGAGSTTGPTYTESGR
jgi:8-oxo-dGTP pyrophosphatase MutT (NUDIX family)